MKAETRRKALGVGAEDTRRLTVKLELGTEVYNSVEMKGLAIT